MQKHRFNIKWLIFYIKLWMMTFLMYIGAIVFWGMIGTCIFGDDAMTGNGFLVVVIIATSFIVWLLGSTVRINRE